MQYGGSTPAVARELPFVRPPLDCRRPSGPFGWLLTMARSNQSGEGSGISISTLRGSAPAWRRGSSSSTGPLNGNKSFESLSPFAWLRSSAYQCRQAGSMSRSTLQSWWSRLTLDQRYPIPSALRSVTRARRQALALGCLHQRCWGGHATRRVRHFLAGRLRQHAPICHRLPPQSAVIAVRHADRAESAKLARIRAWPARQGAEEFRGPPRADAATARIPIEGADAPAAEDISPAPCRSGVRGPRRWVGSDARLRSRHRPTGRPRASDRHRLPAGGTRPRSAG